MGAHELAALAQQCQGAHKDRDGWRAKCPLHQGQSDTSLHLWEEDGHVQVHCFAGCDRAALLQWLDVQQPARRERFEAIYTYHDASRNVQFQVVRAQGKKFFQRRPHPSEPGKYVTDMKGVDLCLYHLPEVLQAVTLGTTIYLVEGEKDVETLRSYGLVATCNPGGAGKWLDSYSKSLANARVVLLPDNDEAGRKHAALVTSRLRGHVKSLVCIELAGLPERGDVTDWLRDHSKEELEALVPHIKPAISEPRLVVTALANIEPEDVSWLWHPYIPLGKICFVEGDPGLGKTYLLLALCAAVTQGYSLPDATGKPGAPHGNKGAAIYITAEDGLADTIRPRADKVGADLSRLFVVEGFESGDGLQPFSFAQLNLLGQVIHDLQARLVVIDPIQAFLGAGVDMFRPNEVRPIMMRLGEVARQHRCAIVLVRHWTKAPGKGLYRGQGSIDFTAAARSVLMVGESPEDETKRVVSQIKNSLDKMGPSLLYGIDDTGLSWYGVIEIDGESLANAQPRKRQHQMKAAGAWLRDMLKSGPMAAQTVLDMASGEGISEKTLQRTKIAMGILSEKVRGAWYWKLPRRYGLNDEDDVPF